MLRKKDTFQVIINSSIADVDVMKYHFKILPKYGFNFITDRKNGNEFIYCNPKRTKKMNGYNLSDVDVYRDNTIYTKYESIALCLKCPHSGICSNKGG